MAPPAPALTLTPARVSPQAIGDSPPPGWGSAWARAWATLADPGVRAVSFDVFDTLLMRHAIDPDGVFERTWRRLRACAPDPHAFPTVDTFTRLRREAHTVAVLRAGGRDVDIDTIYASFPLELLAAPEVTAGTLAAVEYQAEHDLCHGDPAVGHLFHALRRAGKRVGVISDTYWPRDRLIGLLEAAFPGLTPDFVYPSCEWGACKAAGLFRLYLADQGLAAHEAAHIGDNQDADITPAQALGIATHHHPQAPDLLSSLFQRERTMERLLRGLGAPGAPEPRLDGGLRAQRRRAARPLPVVPPSGGGAQASHPDTTERRGTGGADLLAADLLGACLLAPLMAGLVHAARRKAHELRAAGRAPGLLFLARDGHLPWLVWQRDADDIPAAYAGLNRRTSLAGVADDIDTLQTFFAVMPQLDIDTVEGFLKTRLATVTAYFAEQPDGMVNGTTFARALPRLITPDDMAPMAAELRQRLLAHLRGALPAFNACSDLILVDIGFNGTIHRALQAVLRREGVDKRVHGVYLLAVPAARRHLPDGDTAQGLVDERTLPAQSVDYVLRNMAVLELFCSAPTGSIRGYQADGTPTYEPDLRPPAQKRTCVSLQQACLDAIDHYPPPDDADTAARQRVWLAALLARFTLMPTPVERALLGSFQHDINLGTRLQTPLENPRRARLLFTAMDIPTACAAPPPPFWMAASVNALSPALGHAYALNACGLLPGDVYADQPDGTVLVELVHGGRTQTLQARRLRTALGEVRVHIPVARAHAGGVMAVRMADIAPTGILAPVCLRVGDSPRAAMRAMAPRALARALLGVMDMTLEDPPLDKAPVKAPAGNGGPEDTAVQDSLIYRTHHPDARLMIALPLTGRPLLLLTMLVRPG